MNTERTPESDEAFLKLLPHLARIPDDWEDQVFWEFSTSFGLTLCLASTLEEAEKALILWFGRVSRPSAVVNSCGDPVTHLYPKLAFSLMQYLDATLILYGDPETSPWRAPDSSPALDSAAAFVLDAVSNELGLLRFEEGPTKHSITGQEQNRDRYLAGAGLLRSEKES